MQKTTVAELNKMFAKLDRRLLTTGSRLSKRLAAATDPAACKAILKADVHESFRELTEFAAACKAGNAKSAKGTKCKCSKTS